MPGDVWLHTEKRECIKMMKGIRLMIDSLRVSSAGIFIEYFKTIVLLQRYQNNKPSPKMGTKRGINPLYIIVIERNNITLDCSEAKSNVNDANFLSAYF